MHFGDEVRGVFEIPLKDIKNISTTELQLGIKVITCLEFGGHGIAFMGLKSKTIEFTRKISNQVAKAGYQTGSSEEYMPKIEYVTSASRQSLIENLGFESWKGLGLTTAGVIFVIWFLVDTDIGNTMSKKFMSYFKPTFESVMYDGCILEGKHSEKIC